MKIAAEGIPFIVGSLIPGVILCLVYLWSRWLPFLIVGVLFLLFALVCLFFFRSPNRIIPEEEGVLVSPADGYILQITEVEDEFVGSARKVDIFLTVYDVHVNRIPVTGQIEFVNYRPGKFVSAFKDKASTDNERNDIGITNDQGKFRVAQIAGLIARRIVCKVKPEDSVEIGQIYGMIRFGSRTELIFPRSYDVCVEKGQHVKGGETILGRLSDND